MTINEYQKRSYTNIKPHTDFKDEALDYSIGLCEETGEVMNHIKHKFWGSESIDRNKFAKEIGDVLWYLSALCTLFNLDLEAIAKLNIEKLEYRFKDGYSIENSKARHFSDDQFENTNEYKELIKNINEI